MDASPRGPYRRSIGHNYRYKEGPPKARPMLRRKDTKARPMLRRKRDRCCAKARPMLRKKRHRSITPTASTLRLVTRLLGLGH